MANEAKSPLIAYLLLQLAFKFLPADLMASLEAVVGDRSRAKAAR